MRKGRFLSPSGRAHLALRLQKSYRCSTNLILAWHSRPNTVPDYWDEVIPEPVANRDENAGYVGSRIPGKYLR